MLQQIAAFPVDVCNLHLIAIVLKMHDRTTNRRRCGFVPDAGICKIKYHGARIIVEIQRLGEGFCRSKEELSAHVVNDGFAVPVFAYAEICHVQRKENGGEGQPQDDAVGEVIGCHNNGYNEDDNEGVALWHMGQAFQCTPVEGGNGDGDHHGCERCQGDLHHEVVQKEDEHHEKASTDEVGEAAAAAGINVDNGLADHGTAAGAAKESADDVGYAKAAAFSVTVAFGVGHFVDDFRGEESLRKAHDCQRSGIWQYDHEGFHIKRHFRNMEWRQGGCDVAHVADGAHIHTPYDGNGGNHNHCNECRRHGCRNIWKKINDRDAKRYQGKHLPAFAFKVSQLGGENEDGQRVHKADLHGVGNELNKVANPQHAKHKHDHTAEDGGSHKIFRPIVAHQAHDDESHGPSCGGDHGRPSAQEGHEHGEPEGGIESHHGADAGDDAKADDFRDDGEGGDEAGEDVTTNVAKPLLFFLFEVHKCQLPILE